MNIFKDYSKYYDLLYKNKDYRGETDYVDSLIKRFSNNNKKNLLDIGCGTGRHDRCFVNKGYRVTGIDKSPEMVRIARAAAASDNNKPEFRICDSTRFNLDKRFDIAVALFHVMSYQVSNEEFFKTLKNTYKHLKNDGLFIFDFWYGPAVLVQRPGIRVKNMGEGGISVKRVAIPRMNFSTNTVDIAFKVAINNKANGSKKSIREIHPMRYFFLPELEFMLRCAGFKKTEFLKWMSHKKSPDEKTWSGVAIARK